MALAAVLTAGFTVSCDDGDYNSTLAEVKVSQSYVALPADGGSKQITVNASSDWSIDTTGVSSWLQVSPVSGGAGQATVTFSAESTLDSHNVELLLSCAKATQRIQVIQGLPSTDIVTCQDIINGPEAKTYYVRGTVTSIANTLYGNWYLQDETGSIYIYGTLDAKGNTKNFSSLGLEVGDIVTVYGPKKLYQGSPQLVDVMVVNIEKSLIKVDSTYVGGVNTNEIGIDGGELTAYLTSKGNGVSVNIPEAAKSWLSVTGLVTSGTTATVSFSAVPNTGGDRSTTLTFSTTSGSKTYNSELTIVQKGAIVACTVAEFNAAPVSETQYRLTAVVSKVVDAAKGRFYIKDFSGETYAYNCAGFEAASAKAGDIVTLVGKRGEYKGAAQVVSGTVEKVQSVTAISIADFLTKEDNNEVYYLVTGAITEIANETYGNLYLSDGTNSLYAYGCYPGYGATGDFRKDFLKTAGITVGDTLSLIGYKTTYKGTPQISGGIYFSHTKAGAGS